MTSGNMTLESLRDDLPITKQVAYLNTGWHGPATDSVLATVAEEMKIQSHNYGTPAVSAEQEKREAIARDIIADFIHAKPDEIAIAPNTTQAMSLDKIGMRISTGAINSEEEVRE